MKYKNDEVFKMFKENRYGVFVLKHDFIETFPDQVLSIMANCIIMHCSYRFIMKSIYYEAVSPLFKKAEDGCKYRWYKWEQGKKGIWAPVPINEPISFDKVFD